MPLVGTASSLIHPKMLASLPAFFPSTVTFQEDTTPTRSTSGRVIPSPQNVLGLVALPCRVMAMIAQEQRLPEYVLSTTTHEILLAGGYTISDKYVAIVTGPLAGNYDVTGSVVDADIQITRVFVRQTKVGP